MMVRIPPKYSLAQVIGYINGKRAIRVARDSMGRYGNFKGTIFWAREYFVSTVSIDEVTIREHIKTRKRTTNDGRATLVLTLG